MRNRRRSLATLLALAIGSASLLLFGGYIANIRYSMQTAYVRTGGHLQVQHSDFFLYGSGNPTAYGITDFERIVSAIRDDATLKPINVVIRCVNLDSTLLITPEIRPMRSLQTHRKYDVQ